MLFSYNALITKLAIIFIIHIVFGEILYYRSLLYTENKHVTNYSLGIYFKLNVYWDLYIKGEDLRMLWQRETYHSKKIIKDISHKVMYSEIASREQYCTAILRVGM